MKTIQKRTEQELMSNTQTWFDKSFNFISLSNAEKVFDNLLFEHIKPLQDHSEESALEFLYEYGYEDEFKSSGAEDELEYVETEHESEFEDWIEEQNNENYPMWNTLFEFRNKPSEEILEAARKAGFGIIEETDHYDYMLFVRGAGYSFYGAHWIPMYLELPWVEKEEYAHINYSHL